MKQSRVFSTLVYLLAAPIFVAACSGDDAGGKSLIDSCYGPYICVIDGDIVDSSLTKTGGGRCYLGKLELAPDGTSPPTDGHVYTWSGDASRLEICDGARCFSCYPSGSSSPGSSAPGSSAPGSSAPGSSAPGSSSGGSSAPGSSSGGSSAPGPASGGSSSPGAPSSAGAPSSGGASGAAGAD